MKKLINGKIYNTETAELVAEYQYGYCGDFHYFEEALYKSPKGQWFIYGIGGPLSEYRVTEGNSYCGSSNIKLLSVNQVKDWLELYNKHDIYVKYFETEEG